ncbi:scavenger receptor class B member 1 isoform X1 [Ochotona curzoniae]|uniref:scavenger receptor class B member 1 isoform X1 n=1 Tax=Ochotona curzoniae TaxID=130825 RepID=UPI001B34C0E7|nr:scavenger receptor class B member 1 isoform X1 [Ochotona curzoniae]XP_040843068.1 scavenger receptor class B member 1 isoform X1 [Ochotona curzoniae]
MMPTLMLGPCMREGPQRPEVPEGLRRLAWSCEAGAWASLRVLPPQNVRIDPSSLSFNMWKEIPVPFYLSIYFFEVTNPEEVLNGGKPQVRERGPYVYREFRHKENITFNDNDTVSFLEARSFQFQPDKSQGSESDYIVMPNILALSTAVMMEDKPMALKLLVTVMLSSLGQRAFMNRTVGEIMWGYQDPFVNFVSKYFPNMFPEKGKFGLFAGMNNSNSGVFTVFTGVKDFSRIHLVDKWNGLSQVNFWHSNQCNMINGTSGQMWPPFMTPESALEFYSPDACRSLKLVYQEPGVFEGIPTYRFVAPKTLFANGSVYPPNEGFCPCLESGIQNVSSCRFNAPLFLSHPHFYNADPVLAEAVLGLHPNEEEHSLFLDIHPVTGIPMNCSVKLQLSLYMKAIRGIGQTGNIEPVVLPLLWFGESGAMEGETLNTFYTQLVLMPKVLQYAQYVLLALGCVLLLAAVLCQVRSQEKCYLFWSSSKKGSQDKEAVQAYSESLMTADPKGTVLREAKL